VLSPRRVASSPGRFFVTSRRAAMSLPTHRARDLAGAHDGAVLAVRFSRDAAHCVTCGRDRAFALWNARKGTLLRAYRGGHAREVRDASCARDGARIATCGGDRGVFLWDVATGASVRRWSGHEGEGGANATALCGPGDALCASAGYDASVRLWDCRASGARAMQVMHARTGVAFGDSVTSLSVDEDGAKIAAGCVDGCARTIDLRNGKCHVDSVGAPVTSVCFSHDKQCLIVGCLTSRVALLDCASGNAMATYRGHVAERAKTECRFSNTDAHVVASSEDGRVVFWDLVTGDVVRELQAHDRSTVVCSIDYAPEGAEPAMATCAADGTARYWTAPPTTQ
jgi:mitogen-activated protein kinase organizer 1